MGGFVVFVCVFGFFCVFFVVFFLCFFGKILG